MILSNGFFFLISAWKVTDLYGCKIFLSSIIKVCLNKIKFGIQSIYFTMGSGWGAFQNVSNMKFSSVGNISLVLIINLNSTWNRSVGDGSETSPPSWAPGRWPRRTPRPCRTSPWWWRRSCSRCKTSFRSCQTRSSEG